MSQSLALKLWRSQNIEKCREYRKKSGKKNYCLDCGKLIWNRSIRCLRCAGIRGIKNKRGSQNNNWKGGKILDGKGYVRDYYPDHPRAIQGKYVSEHRLVMEKCVDRLLMPDEIIHHIDGDRANNHIDNLMLISRAEHNRIHKSKMKEPK